jgi:tetratricopeptide (TPR) repeat protein
MIGLTLDLRLRRAEAALDAPAAWLLPGPAPRAWLRELARWGRPLLGLRCYLVPAGPDGLPAGLFVLAPEDVAGPPSARALPYRRVGARLYLPADAALDPPAAHDELEACPGEPLLVHPSLGWIGFEPGDMVGPAELLAAPPLRPSEWDAARRGAPPLPPLRGVAALQPPSLDRAFAAARREIGVEPPRARATDSAGGAPPPVPDDPRTAGEDPPSGAEQGLGGWLRRQADSVRAWWRGEEPSPPAAPEAPPDAETLRRERERELRRLAKQLEDDPDQGLRRALPLTGESRRSRRPPSQRSGHRLPERELKLNLDGSPGGRGGDAWAVPPDLHLLLTRRYREAANRELSLGRHERAAYVFLELLGDARAAAKALEQGRRHREAALLYQERLRQPVEAASCLERGGLLDEAAHLYGLSGEDERAARLYRRLGRTADAERHFRRAADDLKRSGDWVRAAALLERELDAAEDALELLRDAWPRHRQAAGCLRARLALLGRLGRHDEAGALVRELVTVPAPPSRAVALTEVLERTAVTYPVPAVADAARDGVRAVAGSRLTQAARPEAEQLLRAVGRTRPDDPLLAKDVGRYVARLRGGERRVPAPPQRGELETVDRIQLPRDVLWETMVPAGRGFYAAGLSGDGFGAVRGRWDGQLQVVRWETVREGRSELLTRLLMAPAASPDCPTVLVPVGQEARAGKPPLHLTGSLHTRRFPADDAFVEAGRIGTPGWIPAGCMAVATSPVGVVLAVHGAQRSLVLSSFDAMGSGAVLATRVVADSRRVTRSQDVHVLALRDHVVLALGDRLELRSGEQAAHDLVLDDSATALTASPRDGCLVVTHARGATACFSRRGGVECLPVGRDLNRPLAAFTREGLLALFGDDEVRCYETRGRQLVHRGSYPWRGRPLGLAPTHSHRFMAVFETTGLVRIVELPAL